MFYRVIFLLHSTFYVTAATKSKCDSLILTPLIKAGHAKIARQLSKVNPENFADVESYSGFLTVKEEHNSNLFFWYFPHEKSEEVPWIIWLQGGPGFSSLLGLFQLVGPIKIEDGKVKRRNITWATDYSLLFVDNPVGAGFSFTDNDNGYTDNEDDVGGQLYELLLQFLEMFPELRGPPLFIATESYGGKYAPALAIQIHRNCDQSEVPINLRGISIGNGLIDPRSMMHYSEICGALGFLEGETLDILKQLEDSTVRLIDEKKMVDAANKFNETIELIKMHSGVSIYNFNNNPSAYGPPAFETFITKPEVRCQIHAGYAHFDLNNQLVYTKMLPDIMNTTKPFLEELLEHYGVLCYSGQYDLILPYGMSRHTYQNLSWSRRYEYDHAPRIHLRTPGDDFVVAYKKSGGNFNDVLIRGAGHMVPQEQPEVMKALIDSFIDEFK